MKALENVLHEYRAAIAAHVSPGGYAVGIALRTR